MKKIVVITFLYLFSITPSFGFATGPDTIINGLRYTDLTTYLRPIFVKAYGEANTAKLDFRDLLFSPEGRYLAFKLSSIESGDPEQVWFIDLKTKKCRCLTDKCTKKIGIRIYHMEWIAEGELKVWYERVYFPLQNYNKNVVVSASLDKRKFLNEKFPEKFSINQPYFKASATNFRLSYLSRKSKLELKNTRTGKIQHVKMGEFYFEDLFWTPDEKHFVYSENYGHGFTSLFTGTTRPNFSIIKITDGSWPLLNFSLSPNSPIIVYPSDYENWVVLYNIARHRIIQKIKTGFWPTHTALSKNNLMAFTSQDINLKKIHLLESHNKLYIVKLK